MACVAAIVTLAFSSTAMAITRWVNDNGTPNPPGSSCSNPGYNTIQDAVAAANPGDIIRVCAGDYTGPVVVDKTLTLRGQKWGVDARTRTQTGESNVSGTTSAFDLQANNIVLDGFRVRNVTDGPGIYMHHDNSGYDIRNNVVRDNVFGIYANTGPANQNLITRNLIRTNNRPGSAPGNGIYTDQGTENLVVRNNTIRGHDNSAVLFTTTGSIVNDNNTVQSNFGLNNYSFVSMFGNNTDLNILANTTNDTIDVFQWGGCTIYVDGDAEDILIANNIFRNPPWGGVCLRDDFAEDTDGPVDIDVNFNRIVNSDNFGINSSDSVPGAASLNGNRVRGSEAEGIHFLQDTEGNTITNNSALRNEPDCVDASTGGEFGKPNGTDGTANFWTNNEGRTDTPNGICHPPT